MPPYTRKEVTLACRGMCVNRPIDKIPEGQYAYLQNVRSYQEGLLEARSGITLLSNDFPNTGDPAEYIHSGYTLNDFEVAEHHRFIGFTPGPPATPPATNGELWWLLVGTPPQTATLVDTGFSGFPMAMLAAAPVGAPVPWLYVYDSAKQAKYSPRYLAAGLPAPYQIGLPIPYVAGTGWISPSGIALVAGPLTGDYFYRYQLRHTATGVISQPGPPTGNPPDPAEAGSTATIYGTVTLAAQSPQWTAPSIPDPGTGGSFQLDIYRWGGTVLDWRMVGSIPADGVSIFTDTMDDATALGAPSLDFSRFQPWITQDPEVKITVSTAAAVPGTGTGDGSGSVLTRISGGFFDQNWLPGTLILLDDSIPLTLRRFISPSSIEVNEDTGTWASRAITITGALRSGDPMPHAWGPYGSGQFGLFIFGCGDPREPGTVKWTNGNDPDSTNPVNSLQLTDPSEPLQNGCVYNGRVYCWSTERMWELIPDLQSGTFIAQVIPGNRGLWAPWALAVGDAMYWVGKDGIYASTGSVQKYLTDADFMAFFPHDANPGIQVTLPNPDDPPNPIQLYSPKPDATETWRLSYGDGMLYFDYLDNGDVPNGIQPSNKTLVYSKFPTVAGDTYGWVLDKFPNTGYVFRYWEENYHSMLVSVGPVLYVFTGQTDDGQPISVAFMTPADDYGDARLQKLVGDSWIDAKPNGVTVQAKILTDYNAVIVADKPLTASGGTRDMTIIDVPIDTFARNVGLWVSWQQTAGGPEIFKWVHTFVPKPEILLKRVTDWSDDGEPMNKWLYGVLLEANTNGNNVLVEVHGDGDVVLGTLTLNHAGQSTKPYDFEATITHQMRLVPVSPGYGVEWQLFSIKWKWNLKPELITWETDWLDDGYVAAKFFQGFVLQGDTAGQNVTLTVQYKLDDGTITTGGVFILVNHDGEQEIAYSFGLNNGNGPFIAHQVRILTTGNIRMLEPFRIRWVWEPAPELAKNWITQGTSHGFHGYWSHRDTYIALQSYDFVRLIVTLEDQTQITYIIPSTGGLYNKVYEILQTMKCKLASYALISCKPFRLFQKDSEMRVGQFARDGLWTVTRPFGGPHFERGAQI